MTEHTKKRAARSPNYPIQSLEWAVTTALELLDKEGMHAVPPDIVAKNLGYKDANNGKVGRVLANLKSFGVIEKTAAGKLVVSQDVRRYKLIPTEDEKKSYLKQWLKAPLLYRKLIEKYDQDLPSDAVLLFELVDEHGFNESAAEKAIKVFRESLDYVANQGCEFSDDIDEEEIDQSVEQDMPPSSSGMKVKKAPPPPPVAQEGVRYPVRLAKGRIAWIEVPEPFYEADKAKLKAQLEIIGTEDDEM